MLEEIRTWCEGLIVSIVICIIIESLIPESNNKKYIKIVSGMYIMFISLSPILSLLNYDFKNIKNYDFIETEETAVILENDMKDVYLIGIELDIKQAIQELGYEINDIRIIRERKYMPTIALLIWGAPDGGSMALYTIASPIPDLEDRKIGGLGIYIAKKTMDEIVYKYENDTNILIMKKII